MVVRFVVAVAGGCAVGGCFALFPLTDYGDGTAVAPVTDDGGSAEAGLSDGTQGEAGAKGADGTSGANPCIVLRSEPNTGMATAVARTKSLSIDGDLSDWGCTSFLRLDRVQAGYLLPEGHTAANTFDFAVQWDTSAIYVAVRVGDSSVRGSNVEPFKNDSIEVYIDGDGNPGTTYGRDNAQIVIDHNGMMMRYQSGDHVWPFPIPGTSGETLGITGAVKGRAGGYDVELKIAASALDLAGFNPSSTLGFGFAGNNGTGADTFEHIGWYRARQACTTAKCCNNLICDPRTFGRLTLK